MTLINRIKAARDAFMDGPSTKRYVTTDILGSGTSYDYMNSNSDIRPNKYGAAYVILKNVPAQRCVDVRSNEVAAANWSIVDRRSKQKLGDNEDPKGNEVARAILRYQEKYSEPFFGRWEQALCVAGENYVQLVRNASGFPADIEWLNPLMVDIEAPLNIIRGYRYNTGHGVESLDPRQVAYDRIPSSLFTDIYGWSPLMSAVMDAGIIINSGRVMSALFRNGATPGGVIRPKEVQGNQRSWTEQEARLIRQMMADNHKGPDQAGRLAVFPFPMDIELFDHPDFQKWADLIKTLETQIYSAYGVPRSVAGDSDSTRYQASPDDVPNFKRLIKGQLSRIQDSFNTTIVPFFDNTKQYQLEFDLSDYEVVPAETVQVVRDQLNAGIITLNESRKMLGVDELANGDVFYLSASTAVVPRDQLSVIQPKPTYLLLQNPQGTLEQASQMAQAVGVAAPDVPTPTQPAPNLTTEEIDPSATETSVTIPQVVDPTKDLGKPLWVGLSLANDNNLIGLQRRLMELYPEPDIKWNAPDDYHVTVLSADVVDEPTARAFCEALKVLPVPELTLGIGQLNSFDRLGEHALHLRIRENSDLRDYQSAVYELATEHGVISSPYSDPDEWKPHVTMGYLPSRAGRKPFNNGLKVKPKGVVCDYDDKLMWQSWEDATEPDMAPAIDEFKAWLKFHRNRGEKASARPFKFNAIPEHVTYRIREESAAGKSADEVYEYLLPLLTGDAPPAITAVIEFEADESVPDLTRMYAAHLKASGIDPAIARPAIERHYLSVLAAKAIQATRIDFEDDVTDLFTEAVGGRIDRRRFGNALRNLIRVASYKAYADGLSDGGVEDAELDDDDIDWLEDHISEQSTYVSGVADAIYKDDAVSVEEAENNKGLMWYSKSISPAYDRGVFSASENGAWVWVQGPTSDKCPDCIALDGIVKRYKQWYKAGLTPPCDKTQCQGFQCKCSIRPTDKAITRARLPRLIGASKAHQHHHEEVA